MTVYSRSLTVMVALTCATVLSAQWMPEFDWVPSGVINVGDRASEAAAGYESVGSLRPLSAAFCDAAPAPVTGRTVLGNEQFVIEPASWRGGPALQTLVLAKRVLSTDPPATFTVLVNTTTAGVWTIAPLAGAPRLYDALFAIPTSLWLKAVARHEQVPITLVSATPHLSLGYRFFATRDWDILGDAAAGDVRRALAAATGPTKDYLAGLTAAAEHDWPKAVQCFTQVATNAADECARLARVALRRVRAQRALATLSATPALQTSSNYYALGLYAGAVAAWPEALQALQQAVVLAPTDPDATYRLAEAMEYNRMPVATFAPLFERAGMLAHRAGRNDVDLLFAIHAPARADMCGPLTLEDMQAIQHDWRYVEQMVYGASRGAYRMCTEYRVTQPGDPDWVMQAGWIFLPPDRTVPVPGTFDYSIGSASYGSSHAGGADCGVNGAGGAQIGAQRSWEVFLHEWNHEFDWTCGVGEQGVGYPTTHDSDGCGKQPIVSMGSGHRSAMYYYMNPAQYRRQEPADPVVGAAVVKNWGLLEVVPAPLPPDTTPAALEAWLVQQKYFTPDAIAQLKREYADALQSALRDMTNPPTIMSEQMHQPKLLWPEFLRAAWHRIKLLDTLVSSNETAYIAGELGPQKGLEAVSNFVNLLQFIPTAPEKGVAYATAAVYSPTQQEVRIWLGYNDCAALWLNGRQIHRGNYYACAKWEDANRPYMLANSGVLKAGWNTFVVKTERGGGDWGFSMHITDFANRPIALSASSPSSQGERPVRYTPLPVGPRYAWNDVRDDYLERLPHLGAVDLVKLTGIAGLNVASNLFFVTLPEGMAPLSGSRYCSTAAPDDRTFNNFLNWDYEHAAALRYQANGAPADLLLIRPEYFDEYLALTKTAPGAPAPAASIVGYWLLPAPDYATVPNRTPRVVLVVATQLPDYPKDDLDVL